MPLRKKFRFDETFCVVKLCVIKVCVNLKKGIKFLLRQIDFFYN